MLKGKVPFLALHEENPEGPPDKELRVLYIHGNQEDLSGVRIDVLLKRLIFCNKWGVVRVACFDYPGYGDSKGVHSRSEEQLREWSTIAADKLFKKFPENGRK